MNSAQSLEPKNNVIDARLSLGNARMLFQMKVPNEADLYCVTASVNPIDGNDPSAKSLYHQQIFKCRHLLFTSPVLASPVLGTERDVLIVASRSRRGQDELDSHLARVGLRRAHPGERHVSNNEYSACLLYTIQAHVAPQWNSVDNILVEGRDFLNSNDPRDAVKLGINVYGQEGCAWLSLEAHRTRIPYLDPVADLQLNPQEFKEFLMNPDGQLEARSIGNPWAHVYPSMKRGMVINLMKRIPPNCLYPTYKGLRSHWKNMYGYRLPEESAEGTLYCEVYFRPLGWNPYTYPIHCISSHRPVLLRAPDPHSLAKRFLETLVSKMPSVCGWPVEVHSDILSRPIKALRSAQVDPAASHLIEEPLIPGTCPLSVATQPGRSKPHFLWRAPPPDSTAQEGEHSAASKENSPPPRPQAADDDRQEAARPLYRPVFVKQASKRPSASSSAKVVAPTKLKLKPTFNCGAVKTVRPESTSAQTGKYPMPQQSAAPSSLAVPAHKPIFLSFKPKVVEKSKPHKGSRKRKDSPAIVRKPSNSQAVPTPVVAVPMPFNPQGVSLPRPAATAPMPFNCQRVPRPAAAVPLPFNPQGVSLPRPAATVPMPFNQQGVPRPAATVPMPFTTRPAGLAQSPFRMQGSSASFSTQHGLAGHQPLLDFKSAEQVRKANVQTLISWLRAHGVPCRVKDKKAELVDKVLNTLKIR